MNGSLATTFVLLFLATAPVMLVVRAWKPGRLPWWLLSAVVGGLSWMSLEAGEHFSKLADAECPPPLQTGNGVLECVGILNDYAVLTDRVGNNLPSWQKLMSTSECAELMKVLYENQKSRMGF